MRAGFTLIELLVVVLIIGILAAVALPQYNAAVGKSRFVQYLTYEDLIVKAEKIYFAENGAYTKDLGDLSVGLPGQCSPAGNGYACKDGWFVYVNADANWYLAIINENIGIQFYNYFANPTTWRSCRARKDNSTANKICLGQGGVFHDSSGDFNTYMLP